jgi:hypothetical protein
MSTDKLDRWTPDVYRENLEDVRFWVHHYYKDYNRILADKNKLGIKYESIQRDCKRVHRAIIETIIFRHGLGKQSMKQYVKICRYQRIVSSYRATLERIQHKKE